MKRIILTGGGTAGHVTPNMALIPHLQAAGYDVHYIGSYDGIERRLIEEDMKIPYHGIASGKLRRYFDVRNFSDPFRVIKGCGEASRLLKALKPDIVFSKGGFVSVPVVLAAKRRHIPCIIHESDMTPGLANKIAIPCAVKVCCNFPETVDCLPKGKAVLTGSPIREELFTGNRDSARRQLHFTEGKPTLMVIGGSLGSVAINNAIRQNLTALLSQYQIIHCCGKGNLDPSLENLDGYRQFEFVKKELASYLALADVVVSRAGANAICELLALRKPNLLIPLSLEASRGDQIRNAESFEKSGYSKVLQESEVNQDTLLAAIDDVYRNRAQYIQNMNQSALATPITTIVELIQKEQEKSCLHSKAK